MSRYASGRAFEYRVRDELRARGYLVIRAAGSKGVCDLVALANGSVLLVQCKRGRCSVAERKALWDCARRANAVALIATYQPRGPIGWQRIGQDGTMEPAQHPTAGQPRMRAHAEMASPSPQVRVKRGSKYVRPDFHATEE